MTGSTWGAGALDPAPHSGGSAQGELLRGAAVAVVDLQPRTVAGRAVGRVQAPAGLWVAQRAVGLLLPDLAADAVAVPQFDLGAVGRAVAVDVEAASERTQRAIRLVE